MRDFRNKPFPIRFKVEYFQKTLTVRNKILKNREIRAFPYFKQHDNMEINSYAKLFSLVAKWSFIFS